MEFMINLKISENIAEQLSTFDGENLKIYCMI